MFRWPLTLSIGGSPVISRNEFLEKVEKTDGCWIWRGAYKGQGYGAVCYNGEMDAAHRMAYRLFVGEIPEGLFVCHHCDVRGCVRPDHLFVGTCKDNLRDMARKGRSTRGVRNTQAKLTDAQILELRQRYLAGESPRLLAKAYGISRSNVWNIGSRQSWKHLDGGREKSKVHRNARLTPEQVKQIRDRYAEGGVFQGQLAEEFGVSQGQISRIVLRYEWIT